MRSAVKLHRQLADPDALPRPRDARKGALLREAVDLLRGGK